jgi:hypothetical protein
MRAIFADRGITLDAAWSLGVDAFEQICTIIQQNRYGTMIEFGSGYSTISWALACPELRIISFEHSQLFYEQTLELVKRINLAERVQVLYAPLRKCWIDGRPFTSYQSMPITQPVDVVIIDGPPHTTRRGREACLYFAYDAVQVGGAVVLDDYQRPDERQIVKNWQSVYPLSFRQEFLMTGHGLAVLYKIHHEKRSIHFDVLRDTYQVQYQQLTFGAKVRLAKLLHR